MIYKFRGLHIKYISYNSVYSMLRIHDVSNRMVNMVRGSDVESVHMWDEWAMNGNVSNVSKDGRGERGERE